MFDARKERGDFSSVYERIMTSFGIEPIIHGAIARNNVQTAIARNAELTVQIGRIELVVLDLERSRLRSTLRRDHIDEATLENLMRSQGSARLLLAVQLGAAYVSAEAVSVNQRGEREFVDRGKGRINPDVVYSVLGGVTLAESETYSDKSPNGLAIHQRSTVELWQPKDVRDLQTGRELTMPDSPNYNDSGISPYMRGGHKRKHGRLRQ
jgi:hypothetical protein